MATYLMILTPAAILTRLQGSCLRTAPALGASGQPRAA
jgi:hypothetical protein